MSLKTRRILYITFIFAFFIITPMVIFYATGYKFNLQGVKLEKTGVFILDSSPQGAKIYVNGKLQQAFLKKIFSQESNYITTPAKIKGFLPDEYDITMELDGYFPWNKKLTIYPNTSTYAEDVFLYKKSLPISVLAEKINSLELSPDKTKLAALADGRIAILNLSNGGQNSLPAPSEYSTSSSAWSPDGNNLLIGNVIINDTGAPTIDLYKYGKNIYAAAWDEANGNMLYYRNDDDLFSFELSAKIPAKILSNKQFDSYLIKNGNIFLTKKTGAAMNLEIYNINSGQPVGNISLPGLISYNFINPSHQLLNLYDSVGQKLYLIDPFSTYSPLRATLDNVKYANWTNGNKLLYGNDFELWLFNLDDSRKTLLTRISQEIKNAVWHPDNNYVIYNTNDVIYAIELDEREKRNITEMLKFNDISDLSINKQGNILYFRATVGNREGLYSLEIN